MKDFDEDLRELLHEKARDANVAPTLPRRVASRGRRRQIGTALLAGGTAALIVAASVVGLKSVQNGRATTPLSGAGEPGELGERTSTIQDFTITAPAGWTLIDRWSARSSISATAAGPTGSAPSTAPIDTWVRLPAPVLELAADDPGLDAASACGGDSTLPSTQAIMVVILGTAPGLTNGPTGSTIPTGPMPLDPDTTPPQSGPCGQGIYTDFMFGGSPYFAFFGLGSEVTDGDREALFEAYDGMQARVAPLTAAEFGSAPSYVMAAGIEQGVPWRVELGPCVALPTATTVAAIDTAATACLRIVTGEGPNLGGTPFSEASAAGPEGPGGQQVGERILVSGAVLSNATAVEYRAPDQEPVAATILNVPDSSRSSIAALSGGGEVPARLFWMLVDLNAATAAASSIVQLAADGSQLSSQPLGFVVLASDGTSPTPSPATPSPSPETSSLGP